MALRGSRIENFDNIRCLVASRGLDFWVSSTIFQKRNIGWPQQPPSEKVLKFNLIFHDSTKKIVFSKDQNKAEFKNLDDSEVFRIDFPGLRNLCSLIDLINLYNLTGLNSLYSFIFSNIFLILMVRSSLAPKWHPFLWNESSKIQFLSDIWGLFCQKLLRPTYVTFLKTGWWNTNVQTSWSHLAS